MAKSKPLSLLDSERPQPLWWNAVVLHHAHLTIIVTQQNKARYNQKMTPTVQKARKSRDPRQLVRSAIESQKTWGKEALRSQKTGVSSSEPIVSAERRSADAITVLVHGAQKLSPIGVTASITVNTSVALRVFQPQPEAHSRATPESIAGCSNG